MIVLPFPPSTNNLFFNGAHGGRVKSPRYKAWIQLALLSCRGAKGTTGPYHLTIIAERPDRRARDIDNLVKPISDLLKTAGLIRDDSDALSSYVAWADAPPVKNARVRVSIQPADDIEQAWVAGGKAYERGRNDPAAPEYLTARNREFWRQGYEYERNQDRRLAR